MPFPSIFRHKLPPHIQRVWHRQSKGGVMGLLLEPYTISMRLIILLLLFLLGRWKKSRTGTACIQAVIKLLRHIAVKSIPTYMRRLLFGCDTENETHRSDMSDECFVEYQTERQGNYDYDQELRHTTHIQK